MENQHRVILGYRDLTQPELELMNEIKTKGYELAALLDKVNNHVNTFDTSPEAIKRHVIAQPQRWLARAKTSAQDAIMQAVRAVAQPDDGF